MRGLTAPREVSETAGSKERERQPAEHEQRDRHGRRAGRVDVWRRLRVRPSPDSPPDRSGATRAARSRPCPSGSSSPGVGSRPPGASSPRSELWSARVMISSASA